jgi:hypothetical protein
MVTSAMPASSIANWTYSNDTTDQCSKGGLAAVCAKSPESAAKSKVGACTTSAGNAALELKNKPALENSAGENNVSIT